MIQSTASQIWPDSRTRRALSYVVIMCATVVFGLGIAVYRSVATFAVQPQTRHYLFGLPIDALPFNQLKDHHGARLLVILGEPEFFILAVITLFLVAFFKGDRRLAYITILGPVMAELLTELVAKPGFHRLAGIYYTYPSGHVTATASIMAVLALLLRRLSGRKVAAMASPFITLYVIGSIIGVNILHMHDMIDAIGGLAMGIGLVSFWTIVALQPPVNAARSISS